MILKNSEGNATYKKAFYKHRIKKEDQVFSIGLPYSNTEVQNVAAVHQYFFKTVYNKQYHQMLDFLLSEHSKDILS